MSRRSADLTTTSYAMLGMLAVRPWTTYELAQHLERGVGRLWPPSARSKLYAEPKRLVVRGLARAATEMVGRKRRTRYAITPRGRRILRAWLASPGEPMKIESEQLLKVFFAEHGTSQSLRSTIADIRQWAADRAEENATVARSYLVGTGPFPERAAVLALTGRFMSDFADMVARWADWAAETTEHWPDDPARAEPDWAAFHDIAERSIARGKPPAATPGRSDR
jgi:DNA-binding PadR family transcriptional regulator